MGGHGRAPAAVGRRRARRRARAVRGDRRGHDRGTVGGAASVRCGASGRGAARGLHAHGPARRDQAVRAGGGGVRRLARARAHRASADSDRRREGPSWTAEGQGDDDVGAVDPRPARLLAGVRRRSQLTRLVSPPLHCGRPAGVAVARRCGRGAARRGSARVPGPRHRGGPPGRDARHAARAAARRTDRGHRGDPSRALRRRRPAAGAGQPAARGGRAARRGARRHPVRAAGRRRRGRPAAAAAAAVGPRQATSTWTCGATSTWTGAGCCTACGCSASTGAPRRQNGGPARPGHVLGVVAAGAGGRSSRWISWRRAGTAPPSRRRRPRRPPSSRPSARSLAEVTALVERCLLADLADAYPTVLRALDERVALDADVEHLMAALPSLARTLRYGDVRGTDVEALREVTHRLVVRVCVGLPGAVGALDDDAAAAMRTRLDGVHSALGSARGTVPFGRLVGHAEGVGQSGRSAWPARRPPDPTAARRGPAGTG